MEKINNSGQYIEFDAVIFNPMSQSGAPTTGTWGKGSSIVDTDGTQWDCITSGTPGTWIKHALLIYVPGITKTGAFLFPFAVIAQQEKSVTYNEELIEAPGKWIVGFGYAEGSPAAASLLTLSVDVVGTDSVSITGTKGTTAIEFPNLKICTGQLSLTTHPECTTLNFPEIVFVGSNFSPSTFAKLTSLSFPKLKYVGASCNPTAMALCTSISYPELLLVSGNVSPSNFAVCTSLSYPKLQRIISTFGPSNFPLLTSINMPELTEVNTISPATMVTLISLTFPKIINIGSVSITTSMGAMTTFTLGSTLKKITGNVVLSSCALDVTSVNALLASLVALDGTNGTTLYTGAKTVTITGTSAAPTGQGLTDKATLQARGITVTTN